MSSLESFDIQNNHIAGPIPETLGELENLKYLSLDGNNFSGTIPDIFYQLNKLGTSTLTFVFRHLSPIDSLSPNTSFLLDVALLPRKGLFELQ